MATPPIPSPFESLGKKPFSFYPAVLGIEHNEWLFQRATWSEILVTNVKSGTEVWVPRRFLGEVSRIDEPVMIVGLKRELEYKAGSLWPHERRVIEMPKAGNDWPSVPVVEPPRTGGVTGIRLEDSNETRIGKLIVAALLLGVIACVVIIGIFRGDRESGNVRFVPVEQQSLGLAPTDDVHAIKRKLGEPGEDRWRATSREIQYRVLYYPDRGLYVILMGEDKDKARYIGAMNKDWKPVDSVDLPHAGNTRSMLNRLERF